MTPEPPPEPRPRLRPLRADVVGELEDQIWLHLDRQVIVGRLPFGARPNAPRMILGGLKLTY